MSTRDFSTQTDADRPQPGSASALATDRPTVTLGEGGTPLIAVGGALLKCEHLNPTGSYKDRIAATAIGRGQAAGATGWIGTSSGNGGAAFAAYGARAGLPGTLFVIESIVPDKLRQIQAFGPRVFSVRDFGRVPHVEAAVFQTLQRLADEHGLVLGITARKFNPDAMDGVKAIADEIVSDLGAAPEAVYVPTGGGGLCASIAQGFDDLVSRGLIERSPRIVAVQPAGCAPIHAAAIRGDTHVTPIPECHSSISGLQLTDPPDGDLVLAAVRTSGGWTMAVDDDVAAASQQTLAREHGVFVERAAAVAYAGYLARPVDGAVVLMTGNGLKSVSDGPVSSPVQVVIDDIAGLLR